jgi:group I intron endonuclease
MTDYMKAKVYKLVNNVNDIVYVGSTTMNLEKRMGQHRLNAAGSRTSLLYVSMRTLGVEKFSIVLIADFPCTNNKDLENEEYKRMKEFIDDGVLLYNMRVGRIGFKYTQEAKENMRGSPKRFGSLIYTPTVTRWCYRWMVDGKRKSKSYSENIWGVAGARQKAEAFRLEIYPNYVDPYTEEIVNDLQELTVE